jgi:hypothetical protein
MERKAGRSVPVAVFAIAVDGEMREEKSEGRSS